MKKRKDGRYQKGIVIDGKRIFFYGKSIAEINKKIRAYTGDVEKSRLFKEITRDWDFAHEKVSSYKAHKAYDVMYRATIDEFGDTPINKITPLDIQRFIDRIANKGYSLRTVKMYISLLNLVFKHAVMSSDIETNPALYVRPSKGLSVKRRELPPPNAEEIIKANVQLWLTPLFSYVYWLSTR